MNSNKYEFGVDIAKRFLSNRDVVSGLALCTSCVCQLTVVDIAKRLLSNRNVVSGLALCTSCVCQLTVVEIVK